MKCINNLRLLSNQQKTKRCALNGSKLLLQRAASAAHVFILSEGLVDEYDKISHIFKTKILVFVVLCEHNSRRGLGHFFRESTVRLNRCIATCTYDKTSPNKTMFTLESFRPYNCDRTNHLRIVNS